jgi:hypothetical protein
VRELSEWASTVHLPDRPWLILGKGPTFDRRHEFDLEGYNLLTLNHAVLEQPALIAHLVDIDVAVDCGEALLSNCEWLLIPRHPHIAFRPSEALLEDFLPHVPVLAELDRQGRLLWYNAATGPAEDGAPVVPLRYFSAEAGLGIAARLGAKVVRSLGVDGGVGYSRAFRALSEKTLLSNGQPSFNAQFQELERIAAEAGIDYRPLIAPHRIFIGADPTQRVAVDVLRDSLQEHASEPIRVDVLDAPLTRLPVAASNRPRTPFSFNRFRIPELMGYEGAALYLDSDMLALGDVAEVFHLPFGGSSVLCTNQPEPPAEWVSHPDFKPGRQFSVMLIDCSKVRWSVDDIVDRLDNGALTYEELMFQLAIVPSDEIAESIPTAWNHLERLVPGITKLIHYTVVPTQPWRSADNPLRPVWLAALSRASARGAVDVGALVADVEAGHVRADLLQYVTTPSPPDVSEGASPLDVELATLRQRLAELRQEPPSFLARVAGKVRFSRSGRRS